MLPQASCDETPETVAELARNSIVKAFRVEPDFPLGILDEYPRRLPFCLTPRTQDIWW